MKYLSTIISLLAGVIILAIGYWRVFARPIYHGLIIRESFPHYDSVMAVVLLAVIGCWGHYSGRLNIRNLALVVIFAILASL